MSEKKYKYKVTLYQTGKQPVEYYTETRELAENLKTLYTNMQKVYKVSENDLYATLEEI